MKTRLFVCLAAALTLPALASAADPSFQFDKPTDAKKVEWNVQAKAGLLLTGGNSQSVSLSLGGVASRKAQGNRFLVEAGLAYARSQQRVAIDADGSKDLTLDEIHDETQTTTNAWNAAARYDRFFGGSDQNSGFVSARFSADYPAGKDLLAGGQVGYSRQLYKDDTFETLGEIGYDYTSEKDTGESAVSIHSLREYLQQSVRISATSNFALKVESLQNLNSESAPYASDNGDTVPAFGDVRVNGSATLSVAINTHFSLALGVTLRYDHAPSLLPALQLPYAPGVRPFADRLDTVTEAALVVTLL